MAAFDLNDLDALTQCSGIGRNILEARIEALVSDLKTTRAQLVEADARARTALIIEGCATCKGGANYRLMLDNLTATQARCTALLVELRSFKVSAGLPGLGWDCSTCKAFNGDQKEHLSACRCCGAARPA